LAKIMLWPGAPQRVQIVTGLGRFMRLDSAFHHLNREETASHRFV
jgi:hypothetical protein